MTLDEAITHVEAMATLNEINAKQNSDSIRLVMCPFNKVEFEQSAAECKAMAEEQRQLAEWLKELKQLREQTRWIPVSERLPENHKDVLICLSSDQICIGCYNSHRLSFNNNVIGWGASYAHNWCSNDVIAWMSLPEPYKAESEDNE